MTSPLKTAVDISPETVERIASYFDRLSSEALDAQFIVPMVRGAESEATAKTLRELRLQLTAAEHVRDGLNAACGQWKEAFDAKDAALQQARTELTASEKRIAEAVYQEREACRAIANMVGDKSDGGHSLGYRSAGWEIAELIKGRGTHNA